MANYVIFLTTMEGRYKGKQIPNVMINGNGIKHTFINAVRQFTDYQSRTVTKELVKAKVIPRTAKDEFGLRTGPNSKVDAYWCVKSGNKWIMRKYHKPNPKSAYRDEREGYYEDIYYISASNVKKADAISQVHDMGE